jgi:hypothetical protein
VKRAAVALAALAAATVSLAQQTTPQTPAESRASTNSPEQTAPPAHPNPRISETDKLILVRDCMRQVEAGHPSVPEKDVKAYCDERVKSYSFPHAER